MEVFKGSRRKISTESALRNESVPRAGRIGAQNIDMFFIHKLS